MKQEIFNKLSHYNWFHDVDVDNYNRTVVYVHYMTIEVIKEIQTQCGNVLIHFAASKLLSNKRSEHVSGNYFVAEKLEESIPDTDPDPNLVDFLLFQINNLKTYYNKNLLQDIFYEVHDGKNAITNLSASNPELREKVEQLYNMYGFDVIYDQLS